jgi:AcrR family transcriptional regulator
LRRRAARTPEKPVNSVITASEKTGMSSLRHKIFEAARELYLKEGVEGVSMRKVADSVGISATAIYRHFESKDVLIQAVVVEGLTVLEDHLKPALAAGTAYERLRALIDGFLEFALAKPQFFDAAFLIPNPIGPFGDEIVKHNWTTFQIALEQIAECMERGVFRRDDPMETAITIWAEVHGLVTLYRTGRLGGDEDAFRAIYRRAVERVLAGLEPRLDRGAVPPPSPSR